MSLVHSEKLACPSCAAELLVEFADSVNADRRPDLREAILDGSFQSQVCAACGQRARMAPSLTYLDAARRQWILTLPAEDRPYWESFEQGAKDIFDRSFGAGAPARIVELGRSLNVRVVFGWVALREKLLCEQIGVADADLELMKLLLLRSIAADGLTDASSLRLLDADADGDGILHLGWVDDQRETVSEKFHVPRSLIDDMALDKVAWQDLQNLIASGPFVDLARVLVEPELPVAT